MTTLALHSHIRRFTFMAIAAVMLALGGCKASKSSVTTESTEPGWSDIYVPVKLELTEPSRMSISGRATMVRDKSIYLSLRMIGMEVATVYIDTDSIFATEKVHKQMLGVDFDSVLGNRLTVGELQDLLLGDANAHVGKLPKALSYEVTRSDNGNSVVVNLKVVNDDKTYAGRLTWDMGSAQYDTGSPRQWRRPSDYSIIDVTKLPRLLESL